MTKNPRHLMNKRRAPGKCIFCQVTGNLSKQHILPNRIRHLIPRVGTMHSGIQTYYSHGPNTLAVAPKITTRNGAFGTRQLRVVCKPCNEGWMRIAEEEAIGILHPLILGNSRILSQEDCEKIELFCSIIFTMVDLDDPKMSGVSQSERSYIYNNRKAPDSWTLMIGRVDADDWTLRFRHHGLGTAVRGHPLPATPNAQVCTIGIGHLLLHCASFSRNAFLNSSELYSASCRMSLIKPFRSELNSREFPSLDAKSAANVADRIFMKTLASGVQ